ncbi:hypothetical protein [Celeribacter sp. HF31]|nr:hypothetical protein [Celeribacter sp. HF31]
MRKRIFDKNFHPGKVSFSGAIFGGNHITPSMAGSGNHSEHSTALGTSTY